ncbi:MAG: nitroreductase family protein [Bacteroidota bacterium]
MEKSNKIDHPVFSEIEHRKSIRAFTNKPIEQDKINSLFEAARWSFSSSNEQAWTYIYATKDQPLWTDLYNCLVESNQEWCKHAPMLILTLAKKQTSKDKPYRHNLHDVGASSMLMALQAVNLGFQVHPMAGFDGEKARATFNIPDRFETVTMMAAGYASHDVSHLKDYQQKAEKERGERFVQREFVLNTKF